MDPGRPKQLTGAGVLPGTPALESVVHAHSDQLIKLNTELSSAFAQVTGEMGDLRTAATSTSTTITALANQVSTLTGLVTRLLPAQGEGATNPGIPTAPLQHSIPVPVPSTDPPTGARWEPSLAPPNTYAGGFDLCRGFVTQCELHFKHQSSRYLTDGSRVAMIMASLSGRALNWAGATIRQNPHLADNLPEFLEEFRRVFDHPTEGSDAAGRLHAIQQGSRSVADYTLEFRTLAADSGWDDIALRSAYRRGLSEELKDLLVRDRPTSLNELATLAHRLDDRLRERRRERAQMREGPSRKNPIRHGESQTMRNTVTTNPVCFPSGTEVSRSTEGEEPMQLGRTRLTPDAREKRYLERRCFYCGGGGHVLRTCPTRPKDPAH